MASSAPRWALFPASVTALGFGLVVAGVVARSAETAGRDEAAIAPMPFSASTIPPPTRIVPRGLPLAPGALPELVDVRWAEAWEDRRALFRWQDDVRAYAVADSLPGGEVILAIAPDRVRISSGETVVELAKDGAAQVIEDFPLADQPLGPRFETQVAPPDPELEAAVYDTLALLQLGEPQTAQVAIDALVGAGEAIVPFLVRRADSLQRFPAVQVNLPDGRRLSPRWEGVAAQAALEAITGQRFGDVLAADVTAEEMLDAAGSWRSWLGLPE
jgi:hypothetical protein